VRFPLLGRPRPACPALPLRIQEITDAVDTAKQKAEYGLADAAHALNKAALVASDGGMPDLARHLCWRHIGAYRSVQRPLTVLEARYMLEPVVNLARLQIRADQGALALQLLEAMYQAVTRRSNLTVGDRTRRPRRARALLAQSTRTQPWEQEIAACLHVMCTEALTSCQHALTLLQDLGDRFGQAITWDSLGYAHHHHGQALACYQHALTLYRDLGDRYQEADTLTNLGRTHHATGNHHSARHAWHQALTILEELHHPDAEQVRTKLATLDTPTPNPVDGDAAS